MQRESTRSADREQTEQRITVMLISVVVVFLVCQLPQAIQKLYTVYLVSTPGALTTARRLELAIGGNFCNLLVMINSAVNFVLYSAFSAKFRQTFERTFCCCRSSPGGGGVAGVPLHTTKLVTVDNDEHRRRQPHTDSTRLCEDDDELDVTAQAAGIASGHGQSLLDDRINS